MLSVIKTAFREILLETVFSCFSMQKINMWQACLVRILSSWGCSCIIVNDCEHFYNDSIKYFFWHRRLRDNSCSHVCYRTICVTVHITASAVFALQTKVKTSAKIVETLQNALVLPQSYWRMFDSRKWKWLYIRHISNNLKHAGNG